jgi:hypothetical protein
LKLEHVRVSAVGCNEAVVRPLLDDPPVLQDDNSIGAADGRKSV